MHLLLHMCAFLNAFLKACVCMSWHKLYVSRKSTVNKSTFVEPACTICVTTNVQ